MTPKEKAEDLIDKYQIVKSEIFVENDSWAGGYNYSIGISKENAKQCALIAVDEIINVLIGRAYQVELQYWQEVKTKIEKL
jgi:hypothetical protein